MLAVLSPSATIAEVLRAESLDLTLANKNGPAQTVLSGATSEIERAAAVFAARGIRAQRLVVAAAFHSSLVAAVEQPFGAGLNDAPFATAGMPVFANTTAGLYPDEPRAARSLLAAQLARPVEFAAMVERMADTGTTTFLEVGPGSRLTGMVSSILQGRDFAARSVDASSGQRNGQADLANALAWLAARGHEIDLPKWDADFRPLKAAEISRRPTLIVPLTGANYVKPKPKRPPLSRPVSKPEPRASMNPNSHPEMNGSTVNERATRPTPIVKPAQAAPSDNGSLAQALALTRESMTALQKLQDQTAQLHRQFLEGQETAQRTVHVLIEQQQRLLHASLTGVTPAPMALPPTPPLVPTATRSPIGSGNGHHPIAPVKPAPIESAPAPSFAAPSAPVTKNEAVERVLLEVVAEKTGYPADMLGLDMALDADLGIDSIKRVEILSTLQDRIPSAPIVKPEHLGTLHTLRQLADFLGGPPKSSPLLLREESGVRVKPSENSTPSPQPLFPLEDEGLTPSSSDLNIQAILLDVVAEKTGYPADMLGLDMALDADLGIDSIKRVEILSTLQDRIPDAPIVKPEHLGTLHTLRQLAEFLDRPLKSSPLPLGEASRVRSEHRGNAAPSPQTLSSSGSEGLSRAPLSPERSERHNGTSLNRYIIKPVPLRKDASRASIHLRSGAEFWLAIEGDVALGKALEVGLRKRGLQPRLLTCANVPGIPCPPSLGGLLIVSDAQEVADAFLPQALHAVQHVGPALGTSARQGGSILACALRIDGAFGLLNPNTQREPIDGGLAGLIKTAAREWPDIACKALDLSGDFSDPQSLASAILDELFLAGPIEVGIANDRRVTLETSLQPQARHSQSNPLARGDVVVLSGGARGVTAEIAVALAAFQPTLILLGRSPLSGREPDWLLPLISESEIKRALHNRANGSATPRLISDQYQVVAAEREIRQTLARIESAGARAVYHALDVRDAAAVASLFQKIRSEHGPVRGLIHGAGVLADAKIENKTDEQFQRVYQTKVNGLRLFCRRSTLMSCACWSYFPRPRLVSGALVRWTTRWPMRFSTK